MIIFLSNDDGIQAPLLPITVEALSKIGDVYVCVPEKEFSSGGHGLSPHNPLWLREVQIPHAARAWTLSGTPADCVKFAFAKLLDVRPDLVVGGINPSPNMATEVLYSGTVAAAIEGCLHGIPSIAMSQNSSKCDPREAAKCLIDIIARWQRNGFQPTTTLSVNYPELPLGRSRAMLLPDKDGDGTMTASWRCRIPKAGYFTGCMATICQTERKRERIWLTWKEAMCPLRPFHST